MAKSKNWSSTRKLQCGLGVLAVITIIGLVIALGVLVYQLHGPQVEKNSSLAPTTQSLPPTETVQWPEVKNTDEYKYRYASVSCAHGACSRVGVDMMAQGGSAVDAAIATAICIGVRRTTSSGIGGGAFFTYYSRSEGKAYTFDFRETAPAAANSTMFVNASAGAATLGGLAIGVPGEVAGFWEAHQRFGKLPWKTLFEPSINWARNGYELDEYVYAKVQTTYSDYPGLFDERFQHHDGTWKQPGELIFMPKLANSLEKIANEGAATFYNGTLKDDILLDLQEQGSIITAEDLQDYEVTEKQPISSHLSTGNFTVYSVPLPSGGLVLQYILNILDGYGFTSESVSPDIPKIEATALTYHRVVEAMKFAYAIRTYLGDDRFEDMSEFTVNMTDPAFAEKIRSLINDTHTQNVSYYGGVASRWETQGTSQISVVAGNGDAVSITTSVNKLFGNKRIGTKTGIIFNNHMDDFSVPGKPTFADDSWKAESQEANWVQPGKRPLSAMSPSVIVDGKGDVRLVTGGSGGAKIITAALQTTINNLWFDLPMLEAVSRPRFHHQLLPEKLLIEADFPQAYVQMLRQKGHDVIDFGSAAVADSISVENEYVRGGADPRRFGVSDGF